MKPGKIWVGTKNFPKEGFLIWSIIQMVNFK